jgi:hypothetical protein
MSNPTYGSDPQSGYNTGATDPYDTGSTGTGEPGPYDAETTGTGTAGAYDAGTTGTGAYETGATDPYGTNVPYEPTDPNAPAAGGYATTGTYATETYVTGTEDVGGSPSTKDVAKDEAGNVKDTAVGAGKQVAGTAKDEAANVAGEAKQQAKSLVGTATSELKNQASSQQSRLAGTLRGYTDQLQGVTQGQGLEEGPLSDLVQRAASRGSDFVSWLENREPADVLDEVRRYARRRPVVFLALCGLAGVVAGRITRGAVAANTSLDSGSGGASPARALTDTSYTTTGVDYTTPANTYGDVTPGATYGAYTDAPAAGYGTEATYGTETTTYPTETTYGTETTSSEYADRGDPTR